MAESRIGKAQRDCRSQADQRFDALQKINPLHRHLQFMFSILIRPRRHQCHYSSTSGVRRSKKDP